MESKFIKRPEIWGGLECSFNRVKNLYLDQLLYCGHYQRSVRDIERIASLGVTRMRYPIIWERLHPTPGHQVDWSSVDAPLNALRNHQVTPIAGLVHHGSGPAYADILQPGFATGLRDFAGQVARRYPWLQYYTPVNEPLTTARFCGLYGLWFPHRKNDRAFVQALLNEMKAVVLSMQEIRKVNPEAKLVQTEDLAKIYSTPKLAYQARFENHRRWLTNDFLCGMVTPQHPLWKFFLRAGATETAMNFFLDNPCPPDIIGVDYYATSERFLDENLNKYPRHTHGSNHRQRYADVEAYRVRHTHPSGIKLLLEECWKRYKIPIAVTEVHINCDFDNQIRWFAEIRDACTSLIQDGVSIEAVTAWALFGSFGWNKLLTHAAGDYESGVFDISSGAPVPTPLADYLAAINENPAFRHPAQNEPGWWRQEERFIFDNQTPELVFDETEDDCLSR